MKEPINWDAIKVGDKIRWQSNGAGGELDAIEFTASLDQMFWSPNKGQHYLIEPRKPVVALPEEPTLGWVTGTPLGGGLGIDMLIQTMGKGRGGTSLRNELYFDSSNVTAFTPATPIPTEALETLKRRFGDPTNSNDSYVEDFLDQVDGAK